MLPFMLLSAAPALAAPVPLGGLIAQAPAPQPYPPQQPYPQQPPPPSRAIPRSSRLRPQPGYPPPQPPPPSPGTPAATRPQPAPQPYPYPPPSPGPAALPSAGVPTRRLRTYPTAPQYALPPEPGDAHPAPRVRPRRGGGGRRRPLRRRLPHRAGLHLRHRGVPQLQRGADVRLLVGHLRRRCLQREPQHLRRGGPAFFARFLWAKAGLGFGRLTKIDINGMAVDETMLQVSAFFERQTI